MKLLGVVLASLPVQTLCTSFKGNTFHLAGEQGQ